MMPAGPENPEEPPTGCEPATVGTRAPFEQYAAGSWRPEGANATVSTRVSVPVQVNETPEPESPGTVSALPGCGTHRFLATAEDCRLPVPPGAARMTGRDTEEA